MAEQFNHIHPGHEKSYGHLQAKGGDKHVTANHERGSRPGYHGGSEE